MKALLVKGQVFSEGDLLEVEREQAKHLVSVLRVKKNDEVFILDGAGKRYRASVSELEKISLSLKINKVEDLERGFDIDLAVCTPKKEAFELVLRNAVEIGFSKIIPVTSKFSQLKYGPSERVERIIESAMIQSNNGYLPEIERQLDLKALPDISQNYTQVVYFCSRASSVGKLSESKEKTMMIIGPEAGLSEEEELYLQENISNIIFIHMPTNILRAPNAVSVGAGLILRNFI